jgi:hypothetical protein
MIEEYNEFIGVYKNVYNEGYCKYVIEQFEKAVTEKHAWSRLQGEGTPSHVKDDIAVNGRRHLNDFYKNSEGELIDGVNVFFQGLQNCYDRYSEKFSVIKDSKLRTSDMKMQRTLPGGGYHIWHHENGDLNSSDRVVVFILYLNTIEPDAGGETEFLYQKTRFQPTENTLILWPAGYTHPHRGGLLMGNDNKYIITGWFHYDS